MKGTRFLTSFLIASLGLFLITSNLPFTGPDNGELPIGPLLDLPNGIDPFLIPPQNRCGWYVPCGTYVMLDDDDEFFARGDSFELDQVLKQTFVFIDMSRSHPFRMHAGYLCQPNRYGVWTADRILDLGSSPERFVHRVSIDVCRNRLPLMECSVEVQSPEDAQLTCDDGRTWVLCQSLMHEIEKLNDDCPDPNKKAVLAFPSQNHFIMAPNDTIVFNFTIISEYDRDVLFIISDFSDGFGRLPSRTHLVMPPGFSVEGGNQLPLSLIKDQRYERVVQISTENVDEGSYILVPRVHYKYGPGWPAEGYRIWITVVK